MLRPYETLDEILLKTGIFIGDRETTVKERAKEIWKDNIDNLTENELNKILKSSNKWCNFFVGMDQVKLTRRDKFLYRNELWRSIKESD